MSVNNTVWQSKITVPVGITPPDDFIGRLGDYPTPSFVISRDRSGNPVSVFEDDCWDFRAYDIKYRPTALYFGYWISGDIDFRNREILDSLKRLIFCLIWFHPRKAHSTKSITKISSALKLIGEFAYKQNVSVEQLLSSYELLGKMAEGDRGQPVSGDTLFALKNLIQSLFKVGPQALGFEICTVNKLTDFLSSLYEYRKSLRQTPPIPSRIYSKIIRNSCSFLDIIEPKMDDLIWLIEKHEDNSYTGLTHNAQKTKARKEGKMFVQHDRFLKHAIEAGKPYVDARLYKTLDDLIEEKELDELFEKIEFSRSPHGLATGIMKIQYLCKTIIQIFTGMRHEEARFLPFDCLDVQVRNRNRFYLIEGLTTKFGEKNAKWVTNDAGARAVRLAQKLANFVYRFINVVPKKMLETPLFITPGYTGVGTNFIPLPEDGVLVPQVMSANEYKRASYLHVEITENDVSELESIDPFRSWREESEFSIGSIWPLKSHQFRRSLALYASCSGMVSLPSLRRQLKHITNDMSLYYSQGSSFAKNMLSEVKDHFIKEYQIAQPIAQSLAYLSDVLLSDERLFGAAGALVTARADGHILAEERKVIERRFKNGEIAYQETVLGGCIAVNSCDRKALRSLTACIGCDKAILKGSKLRRVIGAQERFLEKLNKDSVEYRTEVSELKILKSMYSKVESRETENG
ncbi:MULTISPECIES: TerB family tellurite resistance protein [Halomonadaceae]|uniref:Phage integrase family protein n=1 Tax=Onishia taeanensis TaxID=284577 RepID=A0A328XVJ0_9GAMM|nr:MULTISPECIES: TerB family tellurite resistance protein [Halomonas]RAR64290.1 hypothetical protein BCL93_101109 [Halomonas taeanensis]